MDTRKIVTELRMEIVEIIDNYKNQLTMPEVAWCLQEIINSMYEFQREHEHCDKE